MDWRNPHDYQYTETLSGTGWAWEFLRRNSAYRRDWQSALPAQELASRWGLSTPPPDPNQTAADLLQEPGFLAAPQLAKVITPDSDYLGQVEDRVALGFDLDLPLKEQLDEATSYLQTRQQAQQAAGATMRSVSRQREGWLQALQCLDALESGATAQEVIDLLFDGHRDRYQTRLQQAFALHDADYRELPGLPE